MFFKRNTMQSHNSFGTELRLNCQLLIVFTLKIVLLPNQIRNPALFKMHAGYPNAGALPLVHVSHYLSFSCLHFLRQKLRISVAGVGGWGPARLGIVFSFSSN